MTPFGDVFRDYKPSKPAAEAHVVRACLHINSGSIFLEMNFIWIRVTLLNYLFRDVLLETNIAYGWG
jgi:hypothetical protein